MHPLPVLAALVLLALGSTALAQNVKINSPLAPEVTSGDVQEFAFTPDGTRVVYSADREQRGRFELYSRPLDGSEASLVLSGPMQPLGDVKTIGGFQVSALGRVVYLADETLDGVDELFSVPANGSSGRIRLSQAGPPVTAFQLDSSGTRVAYKHRLSAGGEGYGSLHVVPIDGSAPPVTLWPEATGSHVWFAPDGLRAVFSDLEEFFVPPFFFGSREHLYVIPIDGSTAPVHLTQTHNDSQQDSYFEKVTFPPDGTQVVYGETEEFDGDFAQSVRSVKLDASQPPVNFGSIFSRTGFALDTRVPPRVVLGTFTEVRSSLLDGSSPVILSPPGASQPSSPPRLLGNDVFFSTLGSTIFRAPSDGSLPAVQLFPSMAQFIFGRFVIASPQSIAFLDSENGFTGAFLVPSTGGTPVPLHPPLPQNRGAQELIADPSGQHLLLRGDLDVAGILELYSFDLDDLSRVRLSHEQPLDSDVVEARFAPGGQVVYRTRTFSGRSGLFTVPADASTSPLQLNEPIPTGNILGDVSGFKVTRDGRKLVYRADQATDEHHDLYAVDAVTPGLPVLLTRDARSVEPQFSLLEPPGLVLFQTHADGFRLHVTDLKGSPATELDSSPLGFGPDFVTAHGGRRLVYRKAAAPQSSELWSVLLDGSSAPVRLHAPLPSNREVSAFRVAADGTVVFRSDLGQNDVFELFTVPAKGGTPRRISGPMVANGDVEGFEVDASGKFVAFTADALVDRRLELFVVPLDGSPPERRSGLMPAQGDVSRFVFAGDGRHLVYLADQINDQRLDLFSTPILGAFGPTSGRRLSSLGTTLLSRHAGVRNVQPDFILTADGASVLYRVGVGASGTELFLVPVDGSARPTSMSGPMPSGRAVSAAALAADRGHVVYLADQLVDERFELFSVPFAGGTPVPLDSLPNFGDVVDFEIAQDSRHVVVRADRDADGVFELYREPIDGSAPPVRVNGPLVQDGDTLPGFLALDGRTIYTADQERDEVIELFLTR